MDKLFTAWIFFFGLGIIVVAFWLSVVVGYFFLLLLIIWYIIEKIKEEAGCPVDWARIAPEKEALIECVAFHHLTKQGVVLLSFDDRHKFVLVALQTIPTSFTESLKKGNWIIKRPSDGKAVVYEKKKEGT